MFLFVPIVVCRRNNFHRYNFVVDFVHQSVFLIEPTRPSLFERIMLQLFHLTRTRARMFRYFDKQLMDFVYQRLVAAFGKLFNLFVNLFGCFDAVCHNYNAAKYRSISSLLFNTEPLESSFCASSKHFPTYSTFLLSAKNGSPDGLTS